MREPTDARLNMRLPSRLQQALRESHQTEQPEVKFHAWLRAIFEAHLQRKDENR